MPNKIGTIQMLSDALTAGVNHAIKTGTDITSSGNYIIGYDDFDRFFVKEDFVRFFDLIVSEIRLRPEIQDMVVDNEAREVSVIFELDYCTSYEWGDGDEEIFGCSREEWEEKEAKTVYQPLSMYRMALIGKEAVNISIRLSNHFGLTERI